MDRNYTDCERFLFPTLLRSLSQNRGGRAKTKTILYTRINLKAPLRYWTWKESRTAPSAARTNGGLGLFQVLLLSYPLLDVWFARRATFRAIPGAALEDQPSKALEVALCRCLQSGCLAPRTSLLPHPLQDRQSAMLSGIIAHSVRIPRTAVLSRLLQASQVTVSG